MPTIRTGPRGGKYILKNGKKRYLSGMKLKSKKTYQVWKNDTSVLRYTDDQLVPTDPENYAFYDENYRPVLVEESHHPIKTSQKETSSINRTSESYFYDDKKNNQGKAKKKAFQVYKKTLKRLIKVMHDKIKSYKAAIQRYTDPKFSPIKGKIKLTPNQKQHIKLLKKQTRVANNHIKKISKQLEKL